MDFKVVEYADEDFFKCGVPGSIHGTTGPIYKYALYIQKGLKVDKDEVARQIESVLSDKRSWIRGATRFQRVTNDADTDCLLASPDMVDKLCAPLQTEGEVSCNQGRKVVLNIDRWKKAVPHWRPGKTGRIKTYRQMLVNHEFGHRIGKNHDVCPGPNKLAPVMLQQTYWLKGCYSNPWPLDHELLE